MIDLPEGSEQIMHGMSNSVYKLPNQVAVCKIAGTRTSGTHCSLVREATACDFISSHLPGLVPRVLQAEYPTKLLLSFVTGIPLSEVRRCVSRQRYRGLVFLLGEALGRIHCLPITEAPSELHWPGQGRTWPTQMMATFINISTVVEAQEPDLSDLMQRCRRRLEARLHWLPNGASGLVHGDYGGANILVHVDPLSISGIVDWEWASLADPDLDLARLDWLDMVGRSARIWTDAEERRIFYQGYKQYRDPSSESDGKLRWYRLWFATSFLAVRLHRGLYREVDPLLQYIRREIDQQW